MKSWSCCQAHLCAPVSGVLLKCTCFCSWLRVDPSHSLMKMSSILCLHPHNWYVWCLLVKELHSWPEIKIPLPKTLRFKLWIYLSSIINLILFSISLPSFSVGCPWRHAVALLSDVFRHSNPGTKTMILVWEQKWFTWRYQSMNKI